MKILKAKLHLNVVENGRDSIILFSKDFVNKASKLGYDGLDISFDDAEFTIAELDELKKYADKRNITLVRASEEKYPKQAVSEEEHNKIKTFEDIRSTIGKKNKKVLIVKEISKVLTELEDSKKSKKIIYFSSFQDRKVYDANGSLVGKLKDMAISGGEKFPEVSHILLVHYSKKGNENVLVPWNHVFEWGDHIKLNLINEQLPTREVRDDDILLGEHILDKQVVDVNGLKVIRVNDIAMTYIKGKLAVVSIDVGTRSIFRRLNFEWLIDLLGIEIKNHPVPWGSVEPLTGALEKIHLKVPCPRVSDLHPADVADLFDELSLRERNTILKSMNTSLIGKVLLECDAEIRKSLLKTMTLRKIISIMDKMSPNDAASILVEYPMDEINVMLKRMNPENAIKIQEMLSYTPGSVARYMDHFFVSVKQAMTIEETINYIRTLQKYPDNFHYIYVLDENEVLVGIISLKNLIIANPSNVIKDVMKTKLVTADMSHPIGYVKELITKHDLLSLPVIDISGKMKGVIDIAEILDIIIDETKEHEPLELTDEQKETVDKSQRLRKYYSTIIKDIGKFMTDLESKKPKKQDYIDSMGLHNFNFEWKRKKDSIIPANLADIATIKNSTSIKNQNQQKDNNSKDNSSKDSNSKDNAFKDNAFKDNHVKE